MEISEIRTAAPAEGRAAVELETFALLDRLRIPYAWGAHETADTIAAGDSFNDLGMIRASKAGFLFRSTDAIKADNPDLPAFEEFGDLLAAIKQAAA